MKRGTDTKLSDVIKTRKSIAELGLSNSRKHIETRFKLNYSDCHSPKSNLFTSSHLKSRMRDNNGSPTLIQESETELLELAVSQSQAEAEKLKKKLERIGALFYKVHETLEDGSNNTAKYIEIIKNELKTTQKPHFPLEAPLKKYKEQRTLNSPHFPSDTPKLRPIRKCKSSKHLRLKNKKVDLESELNLIKHRIAFTLHKISKKHTKNNNK